MSFSHSFKKKPRLRRITHNISGSETCKCSKTPWKIVAFSVVLKVVANFFKSSLTSLSSSLAFGVIIWIKSVVAENVLTIFSSDSKTLPGLTFPDLLVYGWKEFGLNKKWKRTVVFNLNNSVFKVYTMVHWITLERCLMDINFWKLKLLG